MAKRSNIIVIIGLAVFVAGAAATFLIVRNDDDGSGSAAKGAAVLVAQQTIPSGTTGGDAVNKGLVKKKSVDGESKPANALSDPSELVGKTAAASIPEGAVLTVDQFDVPQTSLGKLRIPDGKTALALQLGWVQGVGGFVASGDRIDIFGVAKDGPGAPSAKLIMQNTEVLNVNVSAQTVGQAVNTDTKPIFVLAVTPQEAERLVYLTTFQQLYFSLVSKDAPAAAPTPGSGAADALKQLS